MIDVSIIIVHYNTPGLTEACVHSVLEKTEGCTYEVLVVDNASTVGDIAHLDGASGKVRLLTQSQNLGFAGGNNAGWAEAKGAYILLLNSDTELVNDAVTLGLERLKTRPDVGLLSGMLIYPSGQHQHPTGAFPCIKNELLQLSRLEKFLPASVRQRMYYADRIDPLSLHEVDWVWGPSGCALAKLLSACQGVNLPKTFLCIMRMCFGLGK